MTLKQLLKNAGITQNQLASALGVHQSAVSFWCSGATAPRVRDIKKIANLLNVSVEQVLDCFK